MKRWSQCYSMQTLNDIQTGNKEMTMPRRLKNCKACGTRRRDFDRDDPTLCGRCTDDLVVKRDHSSDSRFGLPDDKVSEEELRALICLNVNPEAQEIMDERIKRMTREIQDSWTDAQREKRSVAKKKSCQPLSLNFSGLERKHLWTTT